MKTRRETMLTSKQASKQASKHSITAPFFLVKSTIAYFSKAYSARFIRMGYAFLCCLINSTNFFLIEFTA